MRYLIAKLVLFAFFVPCFQTAAGHFKVSDFFPAPSQLQLAEASARGDTKKIAGLLASGGDVNAAGEDGMTVLMWALLQGNKKGFEYLLEHGANPNARIENVDLRSKEDAPLGGCSTLAMTAMVNDVWFLQTALKHGGNPDDINPVSGEAPIFVVLTGFPLGKGLKHIDALISAHADLNQKDRSRHTPMMVAAMVNRFDILHKLLLAVADPSIKDTKGNTVVYFINHCRTDPKRWMFKWREKVIALLKAKGMDMDEGKPDPR